MRRRGSNWPDVLAVNGFLEIGAEELTYGTPRLRPTPPYAETNSNTTKSLT